MSRTMRAAVVARSRGAEDRVAQAVGRGVTQYLVLGAGLDTFALRAPGHGGLRIYEVDHPATQRWKVATLAAAGIAAPASTVFVPADLETDSLADRLREAGLRDDLPACVSWLGVTPYLSAQAVDATLQFIAGLPKGSGITFDYRVSLALLHPMEHAMEQYAANMFAAAGEPWRSAFDPSGLRSRLLTMGFSVVEGSAQSNARYFARRKDGLQSAGSGFRLAYAQCDAVPSWAALGAQRNASGKIQGVTVPSQNLTSIGPDQRSEPTAHLPCGGPYRRRRSLLMSYITDKARAPRRDAEGVVTVPGQMLEDIVAANPARRRVLRGGLSMSLLSVFGASSLVTACGGDDDDPAPAPAPAPAPTPGPTPAEPLDYSIRFTPVADNVTADTVTLPANYSYDVLFSAGDPVEVGSVGYTGTYQSSAETERQAGGNHDGMHYFAIPGVDPQKGGLLAINHEAMDSAILFAGSYNAATATAEQKRLALSSVGVSIIEVEMTDGKWLVKKNSRYNKRYTGNTLYRVSGPAASAVGGTVVGTLNNCSSGNTPWGTYLTCEETTDNYLDPTNAEEGYGWVVEIDPLNELGAPTKRTAMGRFDHENTAYMTDANNRVAFYMGDDGTPGCIYKFIPSAAFDPNNRAANSNLLDNGTLYVAKFNGDGNGEWVELTQGKNGLVTGATDPGNFTQPTFTPATVNFVTQADVLINTKSAARVAGGTLMDRPEWITVGLDKTVYCTLTNNSSRAVTDAANPRAQNSHGHIIRWKETGDSPLALTFKWEILLLAGDPSIAADNLKGNIVGDTFSSPDGIRVDPQGRLWVQTDAGTTAPTTDIFGANSMHFVDQVTRECKRFLVGPHGCEITGLAYTPDLTTFFINIQHPNGKWPNENLPARSSTIVVRHNEGKPIGA